MVDTEQVMLPYMRVGSGDTVYEILQRHQLALPAPGGR